MESADIGGNELVAAHKRRFSDSECAPKIATPLLSTLNAVDYDDLDREQQPPKTKQRKRDDLLESAADILLHSTSGQWPNLLNLCDELLYEIFKYLDTSSIMALMHCSPRLENLLLDHRFWHRIDLSNGPLPLGILEEILGRATNKTHTIKICGPPSSQHVAGEGKQFTCTLTAVFPKVSEQLTELVLQGISLDFEYIHISEFPSTIKKLVLKDCSVKVGDQVKSIFHTIERQLIELEDLSIEDNDWFEPYYIMALSKLPSLRRLSLKGCQMLCKFVPYGSMAARFGFQKLEVLDLRLTPINNSDLQCFSAIENLRELLLESPPNMPSVSEKSSPQKTSNVNGNDNEEAVPGTGDNILKILNDDEPSTSRRAMEQLRACKIAQTRDQSTETLATDAPTFNSDNCNERDSQQQHEQHQQQQEQQTSQHSDSDYDEDTSTTSASSSDKSDNAHPLSNGHDLNNPMRSPLVVIALPSLASNQQPGLAVPPNPDPAAAAALAAVADLEENPPAEGGQARVVPRAWIYAPNEPRHVGDHSRPQQNVAALLEQMADQLRSLRGNNPAHSRFLPRRDQVIYANPLRDCAASRRRRAPERRGHLDQVMHHPMFWNMIDPLDQGRRSRSRPQSHCPVQPQYFVSDRAIYSFGRAPRPVQPDVVWIRHINRSPDNRLERISLRNYKNITNNSLDHLVQCSPNLVFIDVSGTSIDLAGLRMFKKVKPQCEVVATHLTDVDGYHENELNEQQTSPPPSPPVPPPQPAQQREFVEP
ncbi:uncharacterized protein Dwil_GK11314 [Drosophila willistoni]|uniref:F-box domain-containing protein n=1 Tax=Drosophila willistoni TaxID=7260 RepID=B4NAT2_DROWI|nr:uncharacterized protein LOC6648070 [Drosophila willistoni]EDW80896.1 uncharacterized protein Dwil_GK11314 [Drosophila willistoni]